MPRPLKLLAALALVIFLLSTWALVSLAKERRGADPRSGVGFSTPADPDAPALTIPEFSLIDQNGRPYTRNDLKGRLTVVNFAFTHCPFVCPTLMEKMHGLSVALKGEPVQFLSISVDPVHDTPEVLRDFAKLHDADQPNWTLLTGEKSEVDRIITGGLMFALTPDPTAPIQLPDGSRMDNIIHPSWFVLVGPDAEVKSLYPTDAVNLQILVDDVRRLAKELPRR